MKNVTILLTKYSDWISSIVYVLCRRGYTHASISLEETPDTFYSFNYHGFAIETIEKHKKRGVTKSRCYCCRISDDSYEKIKKRIEEVSQNRNAYQYTRFGVLCCILHIPFHWTNHYFCSQFVAELLNDSNAFALPRSASLFLPNHFMELMDNRRCQVFDNVV